MRINQNKYPEKDKRQQHYIFAFLKISTMYFHCLGLECRTAKWRKVGHFSFTATVRINQSPDKRKSSVLLFSIKAKKTVVSDIGEKKLHFLLLNNEFAFYFEKQCYSIEFLLITERRKQSNKNCFYSQNNNHKVYTI